MQASKLLLLTAFAFSTPHATHADDYFRGDGTTYTLGEVSAGNCNMMAANADAGDNYAALNDVQWSGLKNCGRCAQVSCDDDRCADKSTSQVVQILDRCPECKHGDLDLSPSVFRKLTNSNPSRYKIKWKFVDCPVQGNVKFCLKAGSNAFWTAIQPTNVVSGVSSLKVNGQATTMVDSAYYYLLNGNSQAQTDLSAVKVTLTSVNGETVTDTVSLTAGSCTSGSVQFSGESSSGKVPSSVPSTPPPLTAPPTPSSSASMSPIATLNPTPSLGSTSAPTPAPKTAAPIPEHTTAAPTLTPTTAAPTPPPSPTALSSAPSPSGTTQPLSPLPLSETPGAATTSTSSPPRSDFLNLTARPAITAVDAALSTTPSTAPHASTSTVSTASGGVAATSSPLSALSIPPATPRPSVRRCRVKAQGRSSGTSSGA